jgi:uncharacterized membrane protein
MMHGMDQSAHDARDSEADPQDESERLLAILRRRFAQGEISEAELEEKRRVLGLPADAPSASHVHP